MNFDDIPREIRIFRTRPGADEMDILQAFSPRQCNLGIPNVAFESDAPGV
jgi:hypothetical protein